ncbi:uncharacterized protein SCODWIG_01471 [Saccharomycodes ludwigii]|uniref:Restriction of telomere capping protein 1 n=2 Tax=Saccharomycodes ludwigii TaxID=36035 RepID=A0A376B6I1_9ASCO|nr:uncharacterized protein SCODWIG_01471 [Saccharomycodes ludwigii]
MTQHNKEYPLYTSLSGSSLKSNFNNKTTYRPSSSSFTNKPANLQPSGLKYMFRTGKELSSIDKINDPSINTLVVAGKNHLGLYRFDNSNSNNDGNDYGGFKIHKVKDLLNNASPSTSYPIKKPSLVQKKSNKILISTISDVKAGFGNYSNYVAISGTSTTVSLYDIKRSDVGPIASLNEHTRSINSVDFHMGIEQNNLFLSGGQDGCVKIWDLRKVSLNSNTGISSSRKSDINIQTYSESIRDVKWAPIWGNNAFSTSPLPFVSPQSIVGSTPATTSVNMNNTNNMITGALDPTSSALHNRTNHQNLNHVSNNSNGYTFASIHDSGLLLKYDIRYPSQPEKKINAHSGPGLCMHWHPNSDFIITGGRDGKLCLWYVGDGGNTHFSFPDQVVNVGVPILKLKFQPVYVSSHNVIDSLFATSSMGEDSNVSTFSLARKYIPRNVLSSNATSLGFVWWDENTIFNIDKRNNINGWDLTRAPIQLNNLKKNALMWRDIEGDGLVFVDQNIGGYHVPNTATNGTPNGVDNEILTSSLYNNNHGGKEGISNSFSPSSSSASSNHRLSNATMNTLFRTRSHKGSARSPSFQGVNMGSTSAPFASIKNSIDFQSQQHSGRPSFIKSFTSSTLNKYSNSVANPPSNNSIHGVHPHQASVVSFQSSNGASDDYPIASFISPKILPLDLPYIFNSIRIRTRPPKSTVDEESQALKESPTEVFKFLSRELKFSKLEDKDQLKFQQGGGSGTAITGDSNNVQDDRGTTDSDVDRLKLMNKLGISNSWLTDIKQDDNPVDGVAADNTNGHPDNKFVKVDTDNRIIVDNGKFVKNQNNIANNKTDIDINNPTDKDKYNKNKTELSNYKKSSNAFSVEPEKDVKKSINEKRRETYTNRMDKEETELAALKGQISDLLELIGICDHNAETYLYIDDLMNFKIWILVRDSLLWKIERLTSKEKKLSQEVNARNKSKSNKHGNGIEEYDERTASFTDSLRSSKIDSIDYEYSRPTGITSESLSELRQRMEISTTDALLENENVISEEDDDDDVVADNDEEDDKNEKQQPLKDSAIRPLGNGGKGVTKEMLKPRHDSEQVDTRQRRRSRTSFIDTFMTNLRSPGKFDSDNEISESSVKKNGSFASGISPSSLLLEQQPLYKERRSSSSNSLSIAQFDYFKKDYSKLKTNVGGKLSALSEAGSNGVSNVSQNYVPWAPEVLIKQVYQQAVETGNILVSVSLILLFQNDFHITTQRVAKNALYEFMNILHKYELFEVCAELLKYCPWGEELTLIPNQDYAGNSEGVGRDSTSADMDGGITNATSVINTHSSTNGGDGSGKSASTNDDKSGTNGSIGQSTICIYCNKCGKLLVNEKSKEKYLLRNNKRTSHGKTSILDKFGYWYCENCKKPNTLCCFCEKPMEKMCTGILSCGHLGHQSCFKEWFITEEMTQCPKGCPWQLITF